MALLTYGGNSHLFRCIPCPDATRLLAQYYGIAAQCATFLALFEIIKLCWYNKVISDFCRKASHKMAGRQWGRTPG